MKHSLYTVKQLGRMMKCTQRMKAIKLAVDQQQAHNRSVLYGEDYAVRSILGL